MHHKEYCSGVPSKRSNDQRVIVGWREYVALPDWDVAAVNAKMDTGARTSALDVANLQELPDDRLRFEFVFHRNPRVKHVVVEAPILRRTRIRSSFGASHDRFTVQTRMTLGGVTKLVEFSLVCRKDMHCRMLVGRTALEPEFVVDSSARYLLGRQRNGATSTHSRTKEATSDSHAEKSPKRTRAEKPSKPKRSRS